MGETLQFGYELGPNFARNAAVFVIFVPIMQNNIVQNNWQYTKSIQLHSSTLLVPRI